MEMFIVPVWRHRMRIMIALAAAAIALSSAEAGLAQQAMPSTAPPQAKQPKPDADERIICERDQILGSNVPRRLCMTKSQWDQARDGAQRAIRDQAQDVEPHTQSGGH
jgi:hypothetical protein